MMEKSAKFEAFNDGKQVNIASITTNYGIFRYTRMTMVQEKKMSAKNRNKAPLFRSSFFIPITCLILAPSLLILINSCAQQGQLTGGPKDETPPVVVSSVPPNFSTHFNAGSAEVVFDEYIQLKDIGKQLVISPPMAKKPDIKARGKVLTIKFKDSLQPDRTYAINFGNALVDLNEGNPYKNFQYVFSTGSTLDSLEASGKVVQAFDGKPADDVLVMLYAGTADSLPLKSIPLYISRTDKEGRFLLRNLASGSYKIFALKDGNNNYLFDQPTESVAFLDSLITPSVIRDTTHPAVPEKDTLAPADTLKAAGEKTAGAKGRLKDLRGKMKQMREKSPAKRDTLAKADSVLEEVNRHPGFRYLPDSLIMRMFTEVKPNQYLSGSDRLRRDEFRLQFNQPVDSLTLEFLNQPNDSVPVTLEWTGDPDTIDFWLPGPGEALDSLTAIIEFKGYDSLERRVPRIDTVKLRYRPPAKAAAGAKKDFSVSASVQSTKTLEYGQQVVMTTSLPYLELDTSRILLVSGKDSLARPVPYHLFSDTLSGWVLNGMPVRQPEPRILKLAAPFLADSAYRLTLLPGAFTGLSGQKSDSLDVRFKMKSRDQYGTLKMEISGIEGPVIVELLGPGGKSVVASRRLGSPGTAVFDILPPGKYSARLIIDSNNNGRWDTGRYIRHIQPETVIPFPKEINLKANWDVTEPWKIEDP
jgi:hypothetical protein